MKCIVFGCENEKSQGEFVGDMCAPCFEMITKGDFKQLSNNFIYKLYKEKQINEKNTCKNNCNSV